MQIKHGQCFGNPNPYNLSESTAVHLQFVRQYAPHLYRRTFLASKLRRKGNPAIRLPFVLQYASHCTAVRPPFVRQYFWRNTEGWGHRNVSENTRKLACSYRGNVQPYKNKCTQICTLSLGTALWAYSNRAVQIRLDSVLPAWQAKS